MTAILSALRLLPAWAYWIVLCVAAAGAGDLYGYTQGKDSVQTKWNAENLRRAGAEQSARIANDAENSRIASQYKINNQEVASGHQNEMDAIRASYERVTRRLRISAAVCDKTPVASIADRANGVDAAPAGTVALPDAITEDLFRLTQSADEVTATARALQEWVRVNKLE